tara:strand:- start:2602 stop:3567 length:966 start_codon:yes stop_codon:yes gene_type:complete
MKQPVIYSLLLSLCLLVGACSDGSDNPGELDANVLLFTDHEIPARVIQDVIERSADDPALRLGGKIHGKPVTIVKLSGKTNHFGRHLNGDYIDYHATVPDTPVWIAEYPWTRDHGIQTDESGWWTMYIVKDAGEDLEFSFIYDKEGWITTKSNIITVADEDDTDLAIQYIDPDFYNVLMLPFVEDMLRGNGYPNFFFRNAMVVTVGKSWGSMHDDRLPHGDPGATMTIAPAIGADAIGPIYFNEQVIPDITWDSTSLDGGVVWLNLPLGQVWQVSAEKAGVTYPTVRFSIDQADIDAGVQLFIASPPDSLEGDNDSPPGED